MSEYTGQNLYMAWIYSGGTVVLSTDFRTVSTNQSIGLADASAGADTDKTYLVTIKDKTISYAGVHQAGGTVLKAALEAGTGGTVILAPEGTATGKPKEQYPAISMGAKLNYPYSDVVEVSVDFQGNGARADSTY